MALKSDANGLFIEGMTDSAELADHLQRIGQLYKPLRSVAARLYWWSYLEGKEPSIDQIKKCIRKGTIKGSFVPILTGSAFKNKGVQPLLDAIVDYMPSPSDVESVKGVDIKEGKEILRKCKKMFAFRRFSRIFGVFFDICSMQHVK